MNNEDHDGDSRKQADSSQSRHGLCSPRLRFRTEEERAQFEELRAEMSEDLRARGAMQERIIDQLARTYWKLFWTQEKIATEFENRYEVSWTSTLKTMMWKSDALELALPGVPDDDERVTAPGSWPLGLEHLELTVRGGDRSRTVRYEGKPEDICFPNKKRDQCDAGTNEAFELRLKIGDSLKVLRRYEATLRREFATYLELLHRLQRRRKKEVTNQ
jgi:hypothetical protein